MNVETFECYYRRLLYNEDMLDTFAHTATLDEVTRRIITIAEPERIFLFGSAARGEMNTDSDLDMLVIVKAPVHRRKLAQKIYRGLHGVGIAVDVVVATLQDIQTYGKQSGSVLKPALEEGHLIYEA